MQKDQRVRKPFNGKFTRWNEFWEMPSSSYHIFASQLLHMHIWRANNGFSDITKRFTVENCREKSHELAFEDKNRKLHKYTLIQTDFSMISRNTLKVWRYKIYCFPLNLHKNVKKIKNGRKWRNFNVCGFAQLVSLLMNYLFWAGFFFGFIINLDRYCFNPMSI